MKMIIVTQCCCGCSIRTGSLIIAVVFGIMSILDFIGEVLVASRNWEGEKKNQYEYMSQGEAITGAIFSLCVLAACLSLYFGTIKKRLKFILVWLIIQSAYSSFLIFYIFEICISVMAYDRSKEILLEIPGVLIIFVLSLYSMVVVYSNYRNLKDGVTLPPRTPIVMTV